MRVTKLGAHHDIYQQLVNDLFELVEVKALTSKQLTDFIKSEGYSHVRLTTQKAILDLGKKNLSQEEWVSCYRQGFKALEGKFREHFKLNVDSLQRPFAKFVIAACERLELLKEHLYKIEKLAIETKIKAVTISGKDNGKRPTDFHEQHEILVDVKLNGFNEFDKIIADLNKKNKEMQAEFLKDERSLFVEVIDKKRVDLLDKADEADNNEEESFAKNLQSQANSPSGGRFH